MTEENYWKEKYADIHIRLTNRITELEQENKELKISNSNLDNQLYRTIEMMNNCNDRLQSYRSALEEIKEVASFHTTGADNEDVQNDMQVIIDKIKEVLND